MDKVGVQMQVFKVGTYKSAVEPYILDNMSDANREMTQHFLNNLWGNLTSAIAENRGVSVAKVNQWADSVIGFDDATTLVDLKVVDALKYTDEVKEELMGLTGAKKDEDLRLINYADYNSEAKAPHEKDEDNKIAVYYACDALPGTRRGRRHQRSCPARQLAGRLRFRLRADMARSGGI